MPKSILTIGLELASDAAHEEEFTSKSSLLDWDIVLFKPEIFQFRLGAREDYLGKPCLDNTKSFKLKESCEHWRQEIKQAVDTGKTVVVFLPPLDEVYVATGERQFSGTGRNQKETRIVALHSNYGSLPLTLNVINGSGSAMKLAPQGSEIITPYWVEFSSISEYKVLLPPDLKGACVLTKHGDRPVGALFRTRTSAGSLVLLPDIDFYSDAFFDETDDERPWSDQGKQFAARMIKAVVALDKALHAAADVTPEPSWATDSSFALAEELRLRAELLEREQLVEEAHKRKEEVQDRLKNAGQLRALLYEKGKVLECAIIEALRMLGFHAAPYKDTESEFDVVFESTEGRLLGEAEGKDSKAINVDKLRQLAMNVHEDLQREEVTAPAKGVLFGNGFRLSPPTERQLQFTQKCVAAAQSSSTALVVTTDLYGAAQYLSSRPDAEYAKLCREAILAGSGITKLPTPPPMVEGAEADTSDPQDAISA